MWYGRKDKNWLRWAVHTAECFMDLKIQTNFQVNYAMQGHEIIPDEVNYLKEWVEQIIPNPGRGIEKETSKNLSRWLDFPQNKFQDILLVVSVGRTQN